MQLGCAPVGGLREQGDHGTEVILFFVVQADGDGRGLALVVRTAPAWACAVPYAHAHIKQDLVF